MTDPVREVVLASASPVRRQLLENAGLAFQLDPADLDETKLREQHVKRGPADPAALAGELARAKAETVSKRHGSSWVIGADQILTCEAAILAKPAGIAEAREQLRRLRGRSHELTSAVAVAKNGRTEWQTFDTARLTMRAVTDAFVDAYLAAMGPEVTQSVGGYKIEGRGLQLFERLEGDYFTILGLPLLPLLAYLRDKGILES
ncbi:MAG TPA: nucleoside triphosphate pyrophosphatase [Aestuariivirgaceae bacterium]|nr:nucleoside triphosphate pyrophosphatase [Aestuariivirgaceae bacterium]